ncbi:MAG: hypothetical protein ACLP5V_03785 [Candidatus Bathyarchaeia archaeon]
MNATNQIKADWDIKMTRKQFKRFLIPRLQFLFRFEFPNGIGRLHFLDLAASSTAHGRHLLLIVENQFSDPRDLILIQLALLQSDFRREVQNWDRITWLAGWNRLYAEKVDEVKIRRKRRFYLLRKLLRLDLYDFESTGRFKTVGREIADIELTRELHSVIVSAQREPTFN